MDSQTKKKKGTSKKTLQGKGSCSLPLPPFLLAGMETQRLEPEQASWSMRRKPCLEDRGVARNQIPKDFRKWENGGQTRPYRVVKKKKIKHSSVPSCDCYHGYWQPLGNTADVTRKLLLFSGVGARVPHRLNGCSTCEL